VDGRTRQTADDPEMPQRFYEELFQRASVPMIVVDDALAVIACNASASKILGDPGRRIVGESALSIVPANRGDELQQLLQATLERGTTGQMDLQLTAEANRPRHVRLVVSPGPSYEGDRKSLLIFLMDESDKTELSQRLLEAEKMASLGTLASGVAHHFNNILGGVATFVDYALTSGDPIAMRRALEMTAQAATRVSQITESLLSFTAKGRTRSDLADLTEVVLTFAHLSEGPLKERGIQIDVDLEPMPVYEVESQRINRILANLLSNAEEAMPDGGRIRIALTRGPKHVMLSFSDTGVGIEPDLLPKVFDPFFTTKGLLAGGDRPNPGLGLSVVHGIVREMGGTIRVRSTPGQGTEFTISLPLPEENSEKDLSLGAPPVR